MMASFVLSAPHQEELAPSVRKLAVELSQFCRDNGISTDMLNECLGEDTSHVLAQGDTVAACLRMRNVANDSTLPDKQRAQANFARFFMFGDCLDDKALIEAFGHELVTLLDEAELIDSGRSRIDLRPVDIDDKTFYIASDLGVDVNPQPLDADYVLGVGGASLSLLRLIPTMSVQTALDIGTGCGIQALYMSSFAKRVVVTDISSRALWFAKFNALLNQIDNLDFRQGSFFKPVAGERFDLIVTNPPFVITPPELRESKHYTYRDGGRLGDQVLRSIVDIAPQHLNYGGRFVGLGNWIWSNPDDSDSWPHRLAERMTRRMDWWIGLRDYQSVPEYVHTWLHDGGDNLLGRDEYASAYQLWADGLNNLGIQRLCMGYIFGQRLDAARDKQKDGVLIPVVHIEGDVGSGDRLLSQFEQVKWFKQADRESQLSAHYKLESSVREQRIHIPGTQTPESIVLLGQGRQVSLNAGVAAVIGACDGELSLKAIIDAVAGLMDIDSDGLVDETMDVVLELITFGLMQRC